MISVVVRDRIVTTNSNSNALIDIESSSLSSLYLSIGVAFIQCFHRMVGSNLETAYDDDASRILPQFALSTSPISFQYLPLKCDYYDQGDLDLSE